MKRESGVVIFQRLRDEAYQRGWYVVEREDAASEVEITLTLRPFEKEPEGLAKDSS